MEESQLTIDDVVEMLYNAETYEDALDIIDRIGSQWEGEIDEDYEWFDLLIEYINNMGEYKHPWQKELICDKYGSCANCPYGEFIRSYNRNLTPGNFIGNITVEEYQCRLDGEKLEFWE